jgi:hypothetical protein
VNQLNLKEIIMAQPRKHSTNAERQAAYRARQHNAPDQPLALPAAAGPSSMPSTARWRMALDRATRLMQTVSEEMQAYSDDRSELWHEGQSAERFHESLDQVYELQTQLDDLRSNF